MGKDEVLIINMVKTDKCCFISDCPVTEGYDWDYHRTKIDNIFFDGEKPQKTFSKNWLKIKQYPTTIQRLESKENINYRYEIDDVGLISDKLPLIILCNDKDNYSENIFSLYSYKSDPQEPELKDVKCKFDIVMEVNNFKISTEIKYDAVRKAFSSEKGLTTEYQITNENINHQLFDKMIFPEIMLHTRPCSISSQDLFNLVRQHIKTNIDNKVAKITSDYNFCFSVKKLIPLLEPETVSYTNMFARTKKERNKIKYSTKTFKEVDIFEMTHDRENYSGYTTIQPIFADSELELKNKIDEFLSNLMEIINKPLELCLHCKGTGYKDEM